MDRRTVLKSAGGIVAASALSGCLNGEDSPGDASIWHELTDPLAAALATGVDAYEAETGSQISVQEFSALESQLATAVDGGNPPELYTWTHDRVGNHHDRGFLFDVTEYLDLDVDETFTELAAQAVRTPDGEETIGLPRSAEVPTLLYNREYLDSPPETLDELVTEAEEFHAPDDDQYGFTCPGRAYFLSAYLLAFGGFVSRLDEDDNPVLGIEDDEFHEGMELYRDELSEFQPSDLDYDTQTDAFARGDALFHVNGPWAVDGLRDATVDPGVTSVPEIDGGELSPYAGISLWYFTTAMTDDEGDDRRDTAIDFAEWYCTNDEVVERMATDHSRIPVVADVDLEALPEDVAAFHESFAQASLQPAHREIDAVWGPLDDAIVDILDDGDDIADRFTAAAEEIREGWE
ncbi:substrate-binding domain-containing protein [Natranaeroarchaeum aerophilus]|uniref:Extracellular solute-binding protein n=1 Tax=Natranaeroarchaeum aerophilus TaxID=2917711 RepID=A0AAE3FS66_9EURY|nr:substrate-binding domain-containing protein [Natranaeroarchaeum aerophilus]MCL9813933.1 extracellular solute-binding protein [Natranaeroarchaeum aerophilus]